MQPGICFINALIVENAEKKQKENHQNAAAGKPVKHLPVGGAVAFAF